MLLLVLQLLLFMVLLIVDGEPFRVALRRLPLFSNLDLIQSCVLDLFLGGFVLYVIAILPFGLFNLPLILTFTAVCFLVAVYFHVDDVRVVFRFRGLRDKFGGNRWVLSGYVIVFALFLFVLIMQLYSLSGFVLGGIFDESIHALRVHLILQNNGVPLTMAPYLQEGIIYPEGAHVIFAYASRVLGFDAATSVYHVTVLFKSLPVFGAYFLGRKLSSSKLYPLGLSFIFAFVSSWPLYVTWGSNPFLVGFPLFLVNLGLLFELVNSERKTSVAELVVVGLLFGFVGAIMVSFIEVLAVIGVIFMAYWIFRSRILSRRRAFEFLIIFLVCLLPMASMFYRFLYFYGYPGHNIGLPGDFAGYQSTQMPFTMLQALNWAFEYLSPFIIVRVLMLFFIGTLLVLFWRTKGNGDQRSIFFFSGSVFAAAALLSFVAFFLPSGFDFISWGHQGIIIAVSISMVLMPFYTVIVRLLKRVNPSRFLPALQKSASSSLLAGIIFLALINGPFIYYRLGVDPQVLSGGYAMFAVTGSADFQLMNWMNQNLSSAAIVLVSPYEPGLFIPAISNQKIVYPYTASAFSFSYQSLVELINEDVMNGTTYRLMRDLSISYVYVGSNAAYWWFQKQKWNQLLFLGNPNFELVKNYGDAYLFRFNPGFPEVAFHDDFDREQWNQTGWVACFYGNGSQNVKGGESLGLEITSQAAVTAGELESVACASREIFVQNKSDVTLSASFELASGFSGKDTFAFIVSNMFQNQTVVVETHDGVMQSYKHSVELNASQNSFTVDISSLWQRSYSSPLPSNFLLQLANYDFDGVQNTVYVLNVTVTSMPIPQCCQ
jgi:hypothetical protein